MSYEYNSRKMSSIPVAQTYSQVLEFFQDKSRFAQNYYSYDKEGKWSGWAKGYSHCALGAISRFTEGMSYKADCCLQRVSEHLYETEIQIVNDEPDGYNKVMAALEFAKNLWKDQDPSLKELGMSVSDLLKARELKKERI